MTKNVRHSNLVREVQLKHEYHLSSKPFHWPAEILLWSTDHSIGLTPDPRARSARVCVTPDYLAPSSSPP